MDHHEFILAYVDDTLCIAKDLGNIINSFAEPPYLYCLKDVGPPTRYLGAKIGRHQLDNDMETWFISAEECLTKAIPIIEENYGALKALFKGKLDVPAAPNYHPGIRFLGFPK